ncbi:MAG: 16S rRNA (cytosine(967)-C(5))-methyltransferase RsmB [Sterolibacterium sp.]|jgi:16S rRNA (cytosine967-C5)-methyltransferase
MKSKPLLAPDSLAYALLRAAEVIAGVIDDRPRAAKALARGAGPGRNLDAALAACWQAHAQTLTAGQRGAVQDLAYGTLRQFGRGDFMLGRLLRTPLQEGEDTPGKLLLRALLLTALYRLEARPAEAHTIVDQAVTAAAEIDHGRFKPLVNAVLRNRLRRDGELLAAANADPVARYQHPSWWIEKIRLAHPADWEDILAADNSHPPMTLRVNRRRIDAGEYLVLLSAAGISARRLADQECAILLERPQAVDKLPGFFDGLVSVQDSGAQHAALLLDAVAGMRVLDACAAPGGKATHLLELADVDLLALDAEPARTARIAENLDRLGLHAEVQTADCRALENWWDGRPFQRILADVPCTASGVVRRHPDAKWLRREADIAGFARSQTEILDALWRVLAPGGRMLYCTCSLFPQENDVQMAAFKARHADASTLPVRGGDRTGELQQWQMVPQAEHDGFFYALLQKLE